MTSGPPEPPLPREGRLLLLVCLLAVGQLLVWTALDRRNPDDHDEGHTGSAAAAVLDVDEVGVLAAVIDHARGDRRYPPLATSAIVATSAVAGPSRAAYRLTNLPFLLALVLGTWWLARQLRGPRLALVAAGVVGGLPALVNGSRKMFLHWHAAALTPLFGGFQGLRLYSHHATSPDVLATVAAVTVLGLARSRTRWRAPFAVLGFLAVGGLALGLIPPAPQWSLPTYLDARGDGLADLAAVARGDVRLDVLVGRLVGEAVWIALLPLNALVLVAGLVLAPATRRREDWLLVVLLGIQVPAVLLSCVNGAFLSDWLFLWPTATVLALAALADRTPPPLARGAAAVLLLHALAVAWGPLLAAPFVPDPIEAPAAWDRPGIRWLGRSDTGRWATTHLVPTRSADPWDRIAAAVPDGEGPVVLDITWRGLLDGSCAVADPESAEAWRWGPPEAQGPVRPPPPRWPFVFAGKAPPRAEGARVAVLRVWLETLAPDGSGGGCAISRRLPAGLLDGAELRARERWPDAAGWERLDDPTGRTPGWTVEWERNLGWTGAALLGQRGG
jgi:hypothetical protein